MSDFDEEDDLDEQEKRIAKILGAKQVPEVDEDTLTAFLIYLKKNIKLPYQLTGIEDLGYFGWEGYYNFGPGSKKEHEKLRKTRASFMDTFELLSFEDEPDEEYGIIVNVRRVTDKREFAIPLADMEAKNEKSINYQLLDDYSVWFVNW